MFYNEMNECHEINVSFLVSIMLYTVYMYDMMAIHANGENFQIAHFGKD